MRNMIPAPEGFWELNAYLAEQGVDTAKLYKLLDSYLGLCENEMPDVTDEQFFQAYTYRERVKEFRDLLPVPKAKSK